MGVDSIASNIAGHFLTNIPHACVSGDSPENWEFSKMSLLLAQAIMLCDVLSMLAVDFRGQPCVPVVYVVSGGIW